MMEMVGGHGYKSLEKNDTLNKFLGAIGYYIRIVDEGRIGARHSASLVEYGTAITINAYHVGYDVLIIF